MNSDLIKRAIQDHYSEDQWFWLVLKNPWRITEYSYVQRESIQLNKYTQLDITSYYSFKPTTIHQVYILLYGPKSNKPKSLSCVIDTDKDYDTHIRREIDSILKQARIELYELYRGMTTINYSDLTI